MIKRIGCNVCNLHPENQLNLTTTFQFFVVFTIPRLSCILANFYDTFRAKTSRSFEIVLEQNCLYRYLVVTVLFSHKNWFVCSVYCTVRSKSFEVFVKLFHLI